MTSGPPALCLTCRRLQIFPFCEAYPDGIPIEIASGQADYHYTYEGDHGLRNLANERLFGLQAQPFLEA